MEIVHPFRVILLYLAMQFAPPDMNRMVVVGPGIERMELVREGDAWRSGELSFTAEAGTLKASGKGGEETLPVEPSLRLDGHDWEKKPSVSIGNATMRKTEAGFVLEDASGKDSEAYVIEYSEPAMAEITVYVLGAVARPGVYVIPAKGSLIAAVASAGGLSAEAHPKKVSVVRGSAGEVPKVTYHDFNALLRGGAAAPWLKDQDCIYIDVKIF